MSVPPSVAEWIRLADDDLGAAIVLARQRRFPALVCFHAQQAAEKYVKAVLTMVSQPVPHTHDLMRLYQIYPPAAGPYALQQGDLLALTPYAVGVRYPGFVMTPSLSDARQAILMLVGCGERAGVDWACPERQTALTDLAPGRRPEPYSS
jgi:HEPN domain-containing protein